MSAAPLTAADYSEWCRFAGLYLRNVSHADRYRTFQKKISRAGLAAKIVFDLLESNQGGLDLQTWRNSDVYEMGDDAAYRIEETALALEAIGAPRAAAKVRVLRNTSMSGMLMEGIGNVGSMMDMMKNVDPAKLMEEFRANIARAMPDLAAKAGMPIPEKKPVPPDQEVESWEQVEHLLAEFVRKNESALRGDMARHGDPRAEPGFDPDQRLAELERLRMLEYDREAQAEIAPKMTELMAAMEEKIAKTPKIKPGKLAKSRREFLEHFRKYAGRPADELLPQTQQWVEEARQFQEKHAAIFKPKPIGDRALLKRLAAIGAYDVDMGSKQVQVSWNAPAGLTCDWTEFSLSIKYRIGDDKTLAMLLGAVERVKTNFAKYAADMRREVLQSFEIHREFLERFGFDDYELDDDGKPTEVSILRHAGNGGIHIHTGDFGDEAAEMEGDAPVIQVFFGVDWDDEHGLEIFLEDEPAPSPTAADAEFELPCGVKFEGGGPSFTEPALAAFEKAHDIKLPAEYRQFLQEQNGGVPAPNHLKIKQKGGGPATPMYVEVLYSVEPPRQKLENGLGDAIDLYRAEDKPAQYLPIGRVRMPGFGDGMSRADLLIGLSGKKAGKIVATMPMGDFAAMIGGAAPGGGDPAQVAAMMAAMFDETCVPVAPSFGEFLARLAPAPGQTTPAWLEAIRAGDLAGFRQWLDAKGKLTEEYVPYGEMRKLSVLDYLALEAPPALLQALVDQKVVNTNQLRSRWQQWDRKLARFREMMPILGKSQMHFAFGAPAIWDDAEFLNELLAAGVNLDSAIDEEGATPLHLAIQMHRPGGVRWLLEHGASPGKPDKYGRTGLVWAESGRDLESLKLLIEAGEKLESIFSHMPTMQDKLRLIKSRWFGQFDALADYLRSRGMTVDV